MLTEEELQAEIAARLETMERIRLSRESVELSEETRSGKSSPLDEIYRRLGVHTMTMAMGF